MEKQVVAAIGNAIFDATGARVGSAIPARSREGRMSSLDEYVFLNFSFDILTQVIRVCRLGDWDCM
jgi:hypothetical protein